MESSSTTQSPIDNADEGQPPVRFLLPTEQRHPDQRVVFETEAPAFDKGMGLIPRGSVLRVEEPEPLPRSRMVSKMMRLLSVFSAPEDQISAARVGFICFQVFGLDEGNIFLTASSRFPEPVQS